MNSRVLLLMLVLSVVSQAESPPFVTSPQETVARWLWDAPRPEQLALIPEAERQALIVELRKFNTPEQERHQRVAQRLLIGLGDRETAARVVEEFRARTDSPTSESRFKQTWSLLANSTQPWIIPMLEADLLTEEPAGTEWLGESGVYRSSFAAAAIMFGILNRSPVFSEEARKWARTQGAVPGVNEEQYRATVRLWWRQNKQHFVREDYTAVRPLVLATDARSGTETNVYVESAAGGAVERPKDSESLPTDGPPSNGFWRWVVGGLMLFVVAVALVILARGDRRTKR